MVEIITRYTGPFEKCPTFEASINGEDVQISVVGDDEKEMVIFTGEKFSPEKYEKRGGKGREKWFFGDRIIQKKTTPDQIKNGVVYKAELNGGGVTKFIADFYALECDKVVVLTINPIEKRPKFIVTLEVDNIGIELIESSFKNGNLQYFGWDKVFKRI